MPSISAVIICKNEARNIARCLTSLQGIADEVLVVDGFSTDDTADICRSLGARVIQHSWMGYADTKNFANAQALYPYILSIDADEALSEELKAGILAVKPHLQGAYAFNRLNNYCGKWIKHGGWYPDIKVRLFEKSRTSWKGEVHEQLDLDGQQVTHLAGDLLHYTYYSREEHMAKSHKYAALAAQQLQHKSAFSLWLKRLLSPPVRWIKTYLIQLGFLDGVAGWQISRMAAYEVYLKYNGALSLKNHKNR